jgi:hypothetical protein
MNRIFCIFALLVSILTVIPVSAAPAKAESVPFIIVDSSKESYGSELKSLIAAQLGETLLSQQMELENLAPNMEPGDKEDLNNLARMVGANYILVVDILPIKVDFREVLMYKSLKTNAVLRVRLYNAVEKQYILKEDITGRGSNTTFIPGTSIGKKPAALEAVHKAAAATAQKLGKILVDINK